MNKRLITNYKTDTCLGCLTDELWKLGHKNKIGTAIKALVLTLLAGGLSATPVSPTGGVYAFGDSGSEMGNLFKIPGFEPGANAPYWRGSDGFLRHASGPKWIELLFPGMRVSSDPTRSGERVCYAYDGAMTNEWVGGFETKVPFGLQSQVKQFGAEVSSGKLHPNADSVFVLDVGPNDFFDAISSDTYSAATVDTMAKNIADSVRELAKLGNKTKGSSGRPLTVFVNDLPDFSVGALFLDLYKQMPPDLALQNKELLAGMAADGQSALRSSLKAVSKELGASANIVTLPADTFFKTILANPKAFGFTNTTDPVYDDATDTVLVNNKTEQESYLFIDWLHLTAKGEKLTADYYANVVDAIYGGPQERLGHITDAAGVASDYFASTLIGAERVPVEHGKWSLFADVAGSYLRQDPSKSHKRVEIFPSLTTIGVEHKPSEVFCWGLGASLVNAPVWVQNRALRAELCGAGVGLFAKYEGSWMKLTATGNWVHLQGETRRDTGLPTLRADGRVKEDTWNARITATHDSQLGSLLFESGIGVSMMNTRARGFTEHGAPGLNLAYEGFSRRDARCFLSEHLSFGSMNLGSVRLVPALHCEAAHLFGDRETVVRAQLLDNTAAATEGKTNNGGHWRVGGGPELNILFASRIGLSLRGLCETDFEGRVDRGVYVNLHCRF